MILALGIQEKSKLRLKKEHTYSWSDKGIPHLGINLTSNTASLAKAKKYPLSGTLNDNNAERYIKIVFIKKREIKKLSITYVMINKTHEQLTKTHIFLQ